MTQILGIILAFLLGLFGRNTKLSSPVPKYRLEMITPTAIPTVVRLNNKAQKAEEPKKNTLTGDTRPWGIAQQIDEHTWTMRVGEDKKMGTPSEILDALNNYRTSKGSQPLNWDDKLASFAQERAEYLNSIKTTDGHKGFQDFLDNQNGFDKVGFTWLGENISYGYQMEGVHLIEWLYAGDKPHDDNQRDTKWDHVGIGVKGTATCLIFGTGKK